MDTDVNESRINLMLSSHNINGFKNSKEFLHSRCQDETHAIFAIQEHWLKPPVRKQQGLNLLKSLHKDYDGYGTSAMTKRMESEILKGRPYGGTGFLFSKNLSQVIRPCTQYIHDRVSVIELNTKNGMILLINAYLPFYDTRNLQSQLLLYKETMAYVENIIQSNIDCRFVLLMDLNCNIYNSNHPYSKIINEFMRNYDLLSAYDFIPNFDPLSNYTRCDVKTNSYTLIDNIIISRSLSDIVCDASIAHYGNNVSDHNPVELVISVDIDTFHESKKCYTEYIPWSSLTETELSIFRDTMENGLNAINVPYHSILHGCKRCESTDHLLEIENYYDQILNVLRISDAVLPRRKHGIAKHFWSNELDDLKQKSIDAFSLWKLAGRPSSGPLHLEKTTARMQYKRALRLAKKQQCNQLSDDFVENLLNGDSVRFWKNWNDLESNNNVVTRVDGYFKHGDISNAFADTFSKVYRDQTRSDLEDEFGQLHKSYNEKHANDSISPYLLSWSEFLVCISKTKTGKATGSFVKPQHLLHGSPLLSLHLHLLYNGLIQHEYVPQDFLNTIVTPVIKDTSGDHSDSKNYRPITLSSLFSQLFEHAINIKIAHLLSTNDLQLGFKSKHSCSHALFVLNETVDYFTKHGSNVFVTFLDCSKAFDKVPHKALFSKLIERGVPLCFINLLVYWLSNLTSRVRWLSTFSAPFSITSGVKQGGILSPNLFTVFVDDLLNLLKKSGIGCHINSLYLGSIMYADDLTLLAPTRSAMQTMIVYVKNIVMNIVFLLMQKRRNLCFLEMDMIHFTLLIFHHLRKRAISLDFQLHRTFTAFRSLEARKPTNFFGGAMKSGVKRIVMSCSNF